MTYINSYIDVRARQLYDKLKELYSTVNGISDDTVHEYVLLRDQIDRGKVYKLYMYNGSICTEEFTGTRSVDAEQTLQNDCGNEDVSSESQIETIS